MYVCSHRKIEIGSFFGQGPLLTTRGVRAVVKSVGYSIRSYTCEWNEAVPRLDGVFVLLRSLALSRSLLFSLIFTGNIMVFYTRTGFSDRGLDGPSKGWFVGYDSSVLGGPVSGKETGRPQTPLNSSVVCHHVRVKVRIHRDRKHRFRSQYQLLSGPRHPVTGTFTVLPPKCPTRPRPAERSRLLESKEIFFFLSFSKVFVHSHLSNS